MFQQIGQSLYGKSGVSQYLFKHTTSKTQLMRGKSLWRGAHEKDPHSLEFLIEALMKPGDVVLDVYASTYVNEVFAAFSIWCDAHVFYMGLAIFSMCMAYLGSYLCLLKVHQIMLVGVVAATLWSSRKIMQY